MITLGTVVHPKLLNHGRYNNINKTSVIGICTFSLFSLIYIFSGCVKFKLS